ncbi:MAG: LysR family transcriptional regulator [Coriobacteriales bacterium]|jgi:molybdate transport system regulatory protein|nr:LysR family transcriptional regulator [Coriobacteriales bacterium]
MAIIRKNEAPRRVPISQRGELYYTMDRKKKQRMGSYGVKVRLKFFANERKDTGEFCLGVAQLLQGIADYGSLSKAAKRMGMAYSKAWKLLKECERGLGYPLATRGAGIGSALTREGKKLLMMYQTLQAELDELMSTQLRELLR